MESLRQRPTQSVLPVRPADSHTISRGFGVGAIATDPEGQVLLLVRQRSGQGMYGLPGGFVDAGETAEEALQREVLEEVQLSVTSYRYLVS